MMSGDGGRRSKDPAPPPPLKEGEEGEEGKGEWCPARVDERAKVQRRRPESARA